MFKFLKDWLKLNPPTGEIAEKILKSDVFKPKPLPPKPPQKLAQIISMDDPLKDFDEHYNSNERPPRG